MQLKPQRDQSIEILKCLAALLVVNSHIGVMYARYGFLSTGGGIGDALFFFCSGFTLFLSSKPVGRFDNWYKNRIRRIYPAVFAWAILSSTLFSTGKSMFDIVLFGGGWFVSAIMVYYVLFYVIRRFFVDRLYIPVTIVAALLVGWCVLGEDTSSFTQMYSSDRLSSRIVGFANMLFGACIGLYSKRHDLKGGNPLLYLSLSLCCVAAYYGSLYVCGSQPALYRFQVVSVIPLQILVYCLYRLFNTRIALKCYNARVVHAVVYFVGALCLELYICQFAFITPKFNDYFPFNVLLFFPFVIAVAYVLRVASNLFLQTFEKGDYDWKKIFSVT